MNHNISKHCRWWTTSTACTSTTASHATCPTWSSTCTSTTTDNTSCTTYSSTQPFQPAPMPQLNWSHFKLEYAGKPDQDAEAHLLRTNDWMDTHAFPDSGKVQHF